MKHCGFTSRNTSKLINIDTTPTILPKLEIPKIVIPKLIPKNEYPKYSTITTPDPKCTQ